MAYKMTVYKDGAFTTSMYAGETYTAKLSDPDSSSQSSPYTSNTYQLWLCKAYRNSLGIMATSKVAQIATFNSSGVATFTVSTSLRQYGSGNRIAEAKNSYIGYIEGEYYLVEYLSSGTEMGYSDFGYLYKYRLGVVTSITKENGLYDGQPITFTFEENLGKTYTFKYAYGNNTQETIATGGTGTYTFTPDPERLKDAGKGPSSLLWIYCSTTVDGVTSYGTGKYISLNFPESAYLNLDWRVVDTVKDYIGDHVVDVSIPEVVPIVTEGEYSGELSSTKVTIAGNNYTQSPYKGTTPINSESFDITVKVTDSYGREVTETRTYTALPYTKPFISSAKVNRCDSDGTLNEDGTYAKVELEFDAIPSLNDKNAKRIEIKKNNTAIVSEDLASYDTTSYTNVFSNFDIDTTYEMAIKISDTYNYASTIVKVFPKFTLVNFKADGTGIALGTTSSKENTFEVALESDFGNGLTADTATITGDATINGDLTVLGEIINAGGGGGGTSVSIQTFTTTITGNAQQLTGVVSMLTGNYSTPITVPKGKYIVSPYIVANGYSDSSATSNENACRSLAYGLCDTPKNLGYMYNFPVLSGTFTGSSFNLTYPNWATQARFPCFYYEITDEEKTLWQCYGVSSNFYHSRTAIITSTWIKIG